MLISLIITTYNRPDALAAVLHSALAQTDTQFEIVIADDGSTATTRTLIESMAHTSPIPIRHVWQPDEGFRAGAIRNQAIAASQGDYVIMIDGDCLLRPSFISQHRALAEIGYFVAGNRILLSPAWTKALLAHGTYPIHYRAIDWLRARLRKHINSLFSLFILPTPKPFNGLRKQRMQRWQGAKTCNLAVWKADLIAVNGFDQAYEGWGHEDADLVVRLMRYGVPRKDGHFATTVLHLWHPENDRQHETRNRERLDAILSASHHRAQHGLDQYLPTATLHV